MKYKEYDFIEIEKDGYICKIYKDNMFGMEFANCSIHEKGKEVFHATLDEKINYTQKDAEKFLRNFLEIKKDLGKGEKE